MILLDEGGRARRRAVGWRLEGAVADLAESAWVLDGARALGDTGAEKAALTSVGAGVEAPATWRVIPDAHPHVIVARYPDGRTRARVVGARSKWLDVDQAARRWTVGVRLHPWVLSVLFGDTADRCLDRSVPLDTLIGRGWDRLRGDLLAADSPYVAAELVLEQLAAVTLVLPAPDWKARALVSLLGESPGRRLRDVTEHLGVAPRTLRQTAREWVGLPPKQIERVSRLQHALAMAMAPGRPTGSEVAAACGYADQPHFVRDCSDLLGEPPGSFLSRGAGSFKTGRATGR